jgi:hypothetical protein
MQPEPADHLTVLVAVQERASEVDRVAFDHRVRVELGNVQKRLN